MFKLRANYANGQAMNRFREWRVRQLQARTNCTEAQARIAFEICWAQSLTLVMVTVVAILAIFVSTAWQNATIIPFNRRALENQAAMCANLYATCSTKPDTKPER